MAETSHRHIVFASGFTVLVLAVGYAAFGVLTMLIFTAGFVGGMALWLLLPSRATWPDMRWPYWLAMLLFLVHRVEEKQFGFFDMLSRVTGVPTPDVASPTVIALVLLSVGAWLAVPILLKRQHPLGSYFAWTFLASMGLTELAHWLVFPFLADDTFAYVPGMWSVVLLAPVAWWGMWRLTRGVRTVGAKSHTTA